MHFFYTSKECFSPYPQVFSGQLVRKVMSSFSARDESFQKVFSSFHPKSFFLRLTPSALSTCWVLTPFMWYCYVILSSVSVLFALKRNVFRMSIKIFTNVLSLYQTNRWNEEKSTLVQLWSKL